MQFDAQCILCLIRRQAALAEARGDPERTYRYLRDVMQILLDAPEGVAAPYVMPALDDAFSKYFPGEDRHALLKAEANRAMLALLPRMRRMAEAAADPVRLGLQLARTGNYIDYGALGDQVDLGALASMLDAAPDSPLDEAEYERFCRDLDHASRLLYIGDNAGEIVADLVLAEQLKKRWPRLSITFAVRGGPAQGDATREDAAAVGLDKLVPIVDNGSRIPGTELACLGAEMRRALDEADVILAKGQANFETLLSSGRNVYYLFLCKCPRFIARFRVPSLTGMFLNERRVDFGSPYC